MKEYIEREVAISELECLPDQGELDYLGVFDCVRSVPVADVEPVRHGEWIKTEAGNNCSVCELNVMSWSGNYDGYEREKGICLMHYCPNCGAKMDRGKK